MSLADLFPQQDYRFQMRFERGTFAEFFGPTDANETLLAQRRHWLGTSPETHAAMLPEGVPLLEEAIEMARSEGTIAPSAVRSDSASDALSRCIELGRAWEPDFLLLKQDGGNVRLKAACVCFPSSWSLAEKMGLPVEAIHGPVPGLNPALGTQINSFLSRLKPGIAWLRANWGLSRSNELNQHPERGLPRLDAETRPEDVWLRIENQALVLLPNSKGVLFGIRIVTNPLSEACREPQVAQGLLQALRTMPDDMARYKNIASVRTRLVEWIASEAVPANQAGGNNG